MLLLLLLGLWLSLVLFVLFSTRVNMLLSVALFSVLLLTPTPPLTPTPTLTPDFCDGAPPVGWGTLTPEPGWELLCTRCGEAPPPSLTPDPGLYCASTNGSCVNMGDYLVYDFPAQIASPYANFGGGSGDITLRAVLLDDADLFVYLLGSYPPSGYFDVGGVIWDIPGQYDFQGGGQARYKYVPAGNYDFVFDASGGGYHVEWVSASGVPYSQPGFSLYIYPYDILSGTPTPSPTPQLSWCQTLSGGPAFALTPFVLIGEPNCNMGWDAVNIDGQPPDDLPAFEICSQTYADGQVSLFNGRLVYSLNFFLFAAIAASFWRFLRTV